MTLHDHEGFSHDHALPHPPDTPWRDTLIAVISAIVILAALAGMGWIVLTSEPTNDDTGCSIGYQRDGGC